MLLRKRVADEKEIVLIHGISAARWPVDHDDHGDVVVYDDDDAFDK